jgi:ubiquinone/menaquinone biosynthesis C-methylase UbiE
MDKNDWNTSWKKHLEQYLKAPPRTGIFIKNLLGSQIETSLELGCGSGRDSIYLSKYYAKVTATDYDEKTIAYLKEKFNSANLEYKQADAFNLPFSKNAFDLVFHNGLFVLFDDDSSIYNMLTEQERVSKKFILVLVHNKLNKKLIETFETKGLNDPIYDIRFFTSSEITTIVEKSKINYKSINCFKFGGKMDVFFNKTVRKIPNPLFIMKNRIIPKLYKYQSWDSTERIACLIELNK